MLCDDLSADVYLHTPYAYL
jgi:hypothetical protein